MGKRKEERGWEYKKIITDFHLQLISYYLSEIKANNMWIAYIYESIWSSLHDWFPIMITWGTLEKWNCLKGRSFPNQFCSLHISNHDRLHIHFFNKTISTKCTVDIFFILKDALIKDALGTFFWLFLIGTDILKNWEKILNKMNDKAGY